MTRIKCKVHLCFSFAIIFSIILVGCSSSGWSKGRMDKGISEAILSQDVTLVPKKPSFSPAEKRVEFDMINHTDRKLTYGLEPFLEVQLDGSWYCVPYQEDGGGDPLLLFIIDAKATQFHALELESNYNPLPPGHYRCIVKFEEGFAASGEFDVA